MNAFDSAVKVFIDLIKFNISSPSVKKSEIFYRLATIFAKASLFDQAINHFCLALDTKESMGEEKRIEILLGVSMCYLEKGDYKNASRFNNVALIKNNQSMKTLLVTAWCEFIAGRHIIGLSHVEQAISLEGSNAEAHYIKGRILLSIEKVNEANEAFKRAVSYDKSNVTYINSLGITNIIKGDIDLSFENFIQAIKIKLSIPEIWFNLGLLYQLKYQYHQALYAFKEALNVDSTFYPARVSSQALVNCCFIPPFYMHYMHLKYTPIEAVSPNKNASEDVLMKKDCKEYFKTAPYFSMISLDRILNSTNQLFDIPIKVNSPIQDLKKSLTSELLNEAIMPLAPSFTQSSFKPINRSSFTKLSEKEDVKEDENELKTRPDLNAKHHMKPREQAISLKSTQPKAKLDRLQSLLPISEIHATEDLEAKTLCQLLRSQQKQVQSLMEKHGLILQSKIPQAQALGSPVCPSQKQPIIQALPLRYIVESEETSRKELGTLTRSLKSSDQFKTSGANNLEIVSFSNTINKRFLNTKPIQNESKSINRSEEDLSKKEETKRSNRVVLRLTGKAFSKCSSKKEKSLDTIVKLNISKKRKQSENNKKVRIKEYKTQCKRTKY